LVVQPLTIDADKESIPAYNAAWKLDVASGTWKAITPEGASINDATTGTAQNQFNYSGDWSSSSCTGCDGGDLHSSSTAGATASIAFNGIQILLYSAYDDSSGIMGVTLCDSNGNPIGPEVHVSLRYDAPPAGNYLVYASPVVTNGSYVLKVRVTGLKDLYSTGTGCNIDRALVIGSTVNSGGAGAGGAASTSAGGAGNSGGTTS
jgi:hypothetical protein